MISKKLWLLPKKEVCLNPFKVSILKKSQSEEKLNKGYIKICTIAPLYKLFTVNK